MMAAVMGVQYASLKRLIDRQEQDHPVARKKPGRPPAVSKEVGDKIRACYEEHYQQWGPRTLAEWAQREGLGAYSPCTIAKVIEDLKEPEPPKEKPRRYEIVAPNVMWSEDGAGFKEWGRKKEELLLQDECSRFKVNDRLVTGPATGKDVCEYLREAFDEHGAPLVLKHDGDSIFHEESVEALLDEYGVISLTSPPYYPPFNGKMERAIRDVKSFERAMKKRVPKSSLKQRIAAAIHDLNELRPRPMLGGKTSKEVFENRSVDLPDRDEFNRQVMSLERWLKAHAPSRRQKGDARRIAVERVLRRHGLIKERR